MINTRGGYRADHLQIQMMWMESLTHSLAKQAEREVTGVEEEQGSGLHSIEYSQIVRNYVY